MGLEQHFPNPARCGAQLICDEAIGDTVRRSRFAASRQSSVRITWILPPSFCRRGLAWIDTAVHDGRPSGGL